MFRLNLLLLVHSINNHLHTIWLREQANLRKWEGVHTPSSAHDILRINCNGVASDPETKTHIRDDKVEESLTPNAVERSLRCIKRKVINQFLVKSIACQRKSGPEKCVALI